MTLVKHNFISIIFSYFFLLFSNPNLTASSEPHCLLTSDLRDPAIEAYSCHHLITSCSNKYSRKMVLGHQVTRVSRSRLCNCEWCRKWNVAVGDILLCFTKTSSLWKFDEVDKKLFHGRIDGAEIWRFQPFLIKEWLKWLNGCSQLVYTYDIVCGIPTTCYITNMLLYSIT